MKTSLTELWTRIALERAVWCDVGAHRDVKTLRWRVEHEGESFLTITLPSYARDFEKALDQGSVTPDLFPSFRKQAGFPAFLSGFLECVFNRRTLKLLDEPCVDCVYTIRQLTLIFKKIEGDCTKERNTAAIDSFISCEKELKSLEREISEDQLSELARLGSYVWGDAVDIVDRMVDTFRLDPTHGPGSTADRKIGNQKFDHSEWTDRLEPLFPYGEYAIPNWRHFNELSPTVNFLAPAQERPVKVTLVPKTRKTPRIIAIEPTVMQFAQQGVMKALVPELERDKLQFLGFTDQEPNQAKAREGSLGGGLATLDLSEASDRVMNSIVLRIFGHAESFSDMLQASRSRTAELPNGRRVRLSKFASMGSAVCFPVEAMVFISIVLYGIQLTERRRLLWRDITRLAGRVRIYGDDIIVPVEYVEGVIEALETFGLKVNANKSFWTGKFRESCGADFYDGQDVTPVYCRRLPPTSRRDVTQLEGWVSMANQLHLKGLWYSAQYAKEVVESKLGNLPIASESCAALHWESFLGLPPGLDTDEHLQVPIVKGPVVEPKKRRAAASEFGALWKCLQGDYSNPLLEGHLEHSGRPVAVRIKTRSVPA